MPLFHFPPTLTAATSYRLEGDLFNFFFTPAEELFNYPAAVSICVPGIDGGEKENTAAAPLSCHDSSLFLGGVERGKPKASSIIKELGSQLFLPMKLCHPPVLIPGMKRADGDFFDSSPRQDDDGTTRLATRQQVEKSIAFWGTPDRNE